MRVRVLLVSMLTMASIVSFGQPRPGRAAPRAISATSAESGIWGGGFVNALGGPSPATSTFLAGGDVSGISKLNSSTANWATSNRGLYDAYQLQIASIEFRRGSTTEAYAAFGDGNDNHLNGILKTGNAGDDWALFASNTAVPDLVFNARSPANDYGVESPRATGDLMVLDDWSVTNKLNIYAGSYKHGLLWRNPTTGAWRTIAFGTQNGPGKCPVTTSPCFITTVVAEPAHADVLFVGIHRLDGGDGLWKVTNPRCGSTDCATISAITSSTGGHIPTPEELLDLGTALYCACGSGSSTGGFYYSLTYPFSSMTQNNAGLGFSQTRTTSYPAIARTSNGTLYLGAFNSNCVQTGCQTVFRATGPTGTWSDRIAQGSIQTLVAGTTDVNWWMANNPDNLINGVSYNVSALRVTSDGHVLVSGRSGVWVSETSDLAWQPAVKNLGVTINNDVAADPNDTSGARVTVANTDWTAFASSQGLDPHTLVQNDGGDAGSLPTGNALSVDRADALPSDVYLGSNTSDESLGDVLLSADPTLNGWTSKGFKLVVTARVLGVGVGRRVNDTASTLFAATTVMWYLPPGGSWTQATGASFNSSDGYVAISYPVNPGSVVYAYDRASGSLFRATGANFGSWQPAWAPPPAEAKDATVGGMVADPTNANIVWLTTVEKVHRLDCSVNPCTDTSIAAVANPGPVGIRPDGTAVYVATRPTSGGTLANLYRSSNGSSWTPIADAFYQKAAGFPRQISVGADATATVYVATFGDGVVRLTGTAG